MPFPFELSLADQATFTGFTAIRVADEALTSNPAWTAKLTPLRTTVYKLATKYMRQLDAPWNSISQEDEALITVTGIRADGTEVDVTKNFINAGRSINAAFVATEEEEEVADDVDVPAPVAVETFGSNAEAAIDYAVHEYNMPQDAARKAVAAMPAGLRAVLSTEVLSELLLQLHCTWLVAHGEGFNAGKAAALREASA